MGTTGLETRLRRALHAGSCCPACWTLATLVERMTAGRAAVRAARCRGSPPGEPANLALLDLDARVDARRARLGEPLGELLLRRRRCRAGAADARRGRSPTASALLGGGREPARARARRCRRRRAGGVPSYDVRGRRRACAKLVRAARILGLPTLVSEQYPKGLGHTAPEVGLSDERASRIEKTVFSAARADGFDLRRAQPGARVRHRDARLRQPDRPRPARARASRCTCPRTRSARATRIDYERGLERLERAGAVVEHRRGGAVRAARARRHAGVQGRAEADPLSGSGDATAYVLLEDGTPLRRRAPAAPRAHAVGEVVFTTGMSGYQESMTDPSFAAS